MGREKNLSPQAVVWDGRMELRKKCAGLYKKKQGLAGRKEKPWSKRRTMNLLPNGMGAVPTSPMPMLLVPCPLDRRMWGRTLPPVGQQLQDGCGERKNRAMVPFWASFYL